MLQQPMGLPQVIAIPSKEQRDEVKHLQELQVRTNSVQFALALLAGQTRTPEELIEVASRIQAYITGSAS